MGDRRLLLGVEHLVRGAGCSSDVSVLIYTRSLPPSDNLILSPSITAMNPCRRSSRCSMDIMRTKRKSRVFSQPGKMKRREKEQGEGNLIARNDALLMLGRKVQRHLECGENAIPLSLHFLI